MNKLFLEFILFQTFVVFKFNYIQTVLRPKSYDGKIVVYPTNNFPEIGHVKDKRIVGETQFQRLPDGTLCDYA